MAPNKKIDTMSKANVSSVNRVAFLMSLLKSKNAAITWYKQTQIPIHALKVRNGNVEPLGKVVTDGLERQNWTGSSVDHLWVRGTKTETCQHGDQCWQRPINQRFENVPLAVQKPKSRKFRTRQ